MEYKDKTSTEAALLQYKYGLGVFAEKMPKLTDKFHSFTEECFKDGTLSKKEKQLIALGISLYSQDEYCIIYHTKGCIDQGASEQEILETVGVTAAFGGGPTMSQAVTLVQECIKELNNHN
ncbi:carboxymuconolactone decarboxylase family protein [Bacillus cereus]|uniref:Carboxymuconolactone decarboxylase family protein n=4 Tax=Bacillus cereus group TaxID=86661 RepID=A0ABX6G9X0_9BACI|nr:MULTISPECIES: carboxymuconolactone decarboxylase family protein [Bacillus]KAA6452644.1 carboxymuconolactone decarboxylase family protein [Bacillus cereus]KAB2420382.1 carboxymuconolactone decarboxylase family protein [Bacillus cereus]KAB2444028.1 carboxymuconolactone decarboxylase family protein [Bacillus luti]KAB2458446.1 carboxymuconolactone decarboxylase family protein [Bacillus cereus]KAB2460170.1 carboxymuconolactone decarboxylase family protein [Bacillus sp. CH140a_4T]